MTLTRDQMSSSRSDQINVEVMKTAKKMLQFMLVPDQ